MQYRQDNVRAFLAGELTERLEDTARWLPYVLPDFLPHAFGLVDHGTHLALCRRSITR